ncbi:hypothetical protein HWV62_14696, partial [Athelia sp. TMB]
MPRYLPPTRIYFIFNSNGKSMDFEGDVIETSDNEERENLCTGQNSYWESAAAVIRERRSTFTPLSTRFSIPYNKPSPRKRVKLDPLSIIQYADNSSPEARIPDLPDIGNETTRSSSSVPSACPTSPSDYATSAHDRSPKSSSLIPTPEGDHESAPGKKYWTEDVAPNADSQDPMDMFMSQYKDDDFVSSEYDSPFRASLMSPGNRFQESSILSARRPSSRSPDSRAFLEHTTDVPRATQRVAKVQDISHRSRSPQNVSSSIASPNQSQRPTTPPFSWEKPTFMPSGTSLEITPRSSPLQFPNSSLPAAPHEPALFTPDPVHREGYHKTTTLSETNTLTPQSSPLTIASSPAIPAVPVQQHPDSPEPEIPPDDEGPGRRYSMRQRRPQQLQPYAYDQIMYKQQLKHNPEAIVKLRRAESPVNRGRPAHLEGTEVQSANAEDDTQDWTMDGGDEEEEADSWEERRRGRRGRSASESAPPAAQTQRVSATLGDLSSDEDDRDMENFYKAAKREERVKKRLEKEKSAAKEKEDRARLQREREAKRRKKAFPRRGQTYQSPRNSGPASPVISIPSSPDVPTLPRTAASAESGIHRSSPDLNDREDTPEQSWMDYDDGAGDAQVHFSSPPQQTHYSSVTRAAAEESMGSAAS